MKRCEYREYNFNMSLLYSPHLVSAETVFDLYLDEIDESWTTKIQSFDYVIISAGHWFFHPPMFYLNHRLVGCLDCSQSNVSHLTSYFSYRRAFQMAFRAINSLQNYNGVIFLRTFAPSHFENGTWSNGGDCTKTRPFRRNEMVLDSHNLEFYKIQLQEVRIAQKEGRKRGLKFRLFDVTRPMLLRPDGHPSKYGRWTKPNATVLIDCLHWCLPGPIDTWNDFLLQLLKREAADI
ncbi:protein trichome birefringence-like 19 [Nicotiana tomentosiformis]|uniref:protein trichome birefringence-like 19 n=1 Tax=Nicotiana tomentosiformis TaxID=4098 RepID=UPI00051BAF21